MKCSKAIGLTRLGTASNSLLRDQLRRIGSQTKQSKPKSNPTRTYQSEEDVASKLDSIHERFNAQFLSGNAKSNNPNSWLKEIPFFYNPSHVFAACGAVSGLVLLLMNPKTTHSSYDLNKKNSQKQEKSDTSSDSQQEQLQQGLPLPYPSIWTLRYRNDSVTTSLLAGTVVGGSMAGFFGGKMYLIRINNKNLSKSLHNLVHRTALSVFHSGGFIMVAFYGLIGASLVLESVLFGEPLGWSVVEKEYRDQYLQDSASSSHGKYAYMKRSATDELCEMLEYYNPKRRARQKAFGECTNDEVRMRAGFGMELLAHTMVTSYVYVLPIFLIGSAGLMYSHRDFWSKIYRKFKVPDNLSQTLPKPPPKKPTDLDSKTKSANQMKQSLKEYLGQFKRQ